MVMWKQLRQIHLVIPEELLCEVDAAANQKYMSRSEYIRQTLNEVVHGKHQKAVKQAAEEKPTRFLNVDDS